MKEVFTIDNLFHSLVAVAFTCLSLILLAFGGVPNWLPLMMAGLAMIGLYLRESSQVDWDFTLKASFHKHMEWIVGSAAAYIAAAIIAVVT